MKGKKRCPPGKFVVVYEPLEYGDLSGCEMNSDELARILYLGNLTVGTTIHDVNKDEFLTVKPSPGTSSKQELRNRTRRVTISHRYKMQEHEI